MLESVVRYYAEKLERFGATARGVDWNGSASQVLRFAQLLRAVNHDGDASVIDYGCGYGALRRLLGDGRTAMGVQRV